MILSNNLNMNYDPRQINMTTLMVLDALCRHKNTTRAADELSLTQSAVSRQVAKLKEIAGENLFIRTKHGLNPSETCLALREHALKIFDLTDQFFKLKENSFDPAIDEYEFSIAVPVQKTRYFFENLTMGIKDKYPHLTINLLYLEETEALEKLHDRTLDLYIGFLPENMPKSLNVKQTMTLDFRVICSKQNKLFDKGKIIKQEFVSIPHIKLAIGTHQSAIDREMTKLGLLQSKLISVPDQQAVKHLLKKSSYLYMLDQKAADTLCNEEKNFKTLDTVGFTLPKIKIYQIWDRRHDTSNPQVWIRDYIHSLT